ncbi:MAG: hypothetical protein UZ22_OP11002000428 [Microgenomates bacterium OLB23]|nr:MAG: hypothetical protein UZ22_OP11002000428 [Microgenomates bacterium OLB23]
MKKRLLSVIFFILVFPKSSFASVNSRVYIPTSSQTMIIKEGDKSSIAVNDYLGSVREKSFYPYGEDVENTQTSTDRQFTGHRSLGDAGVYHAGARFYNPQLGQFLHADRVESPHRYIYAVNNPVTYTDPTGTCVTQCELPKEPQYIDLSDYYTMYTLKPEFRGMDIYEMPPDQGIPDRIYYPIVGGTAAGVVVAGGIYAAPVIAGSGVASSISGAAGSALQYSAVQGAVGSVGIEAVAQGLQGDFDAEKLVTQGVVGAVGGKWISSARGFMNPQYARFLEKSPSFVRAMAGSKAGHLTYELAAESVIVSPLIAYGTVHDMQKMDGVTLGSALTTNYLATKAGLKVSLLGRYGGGKLGGSFVKKGLNRSVPQLQGVLTNAGTHFGATNHFRTNPVVQKPIHDLESAIMRGFMGNEAYAH